ncbi:putative DNA repair helicase rad5,16 [Aspergillus terreus]|uniref:Putative DNA repair helicase rad5,16 n=1 Tax=Aspergillus terreus TaxID=33178 RepID=A0A5M3ZBN6_ASPTE|nr:hypothetical protein ATETN484_0013043300 [Aspergillus terreus]GFF20665.1 putative DNA repair helicase rad5,16 [Aspergillus terreus]
MSSSDASSDEDLVNQLLDNDNNQLQDLAEESNLTRFDVTEISSWKGVCDALETDKADYLARCLTGLVAANTQNIEGLFYRKNVSLERKEKIMWAVICLVRQDFALSRVEKEKIRDTIKNPPPPPPPAPEATAPPADPALQTETLQKPSSGPPSSGPTAAHPKPPAGSKRSTGPSRKRRTRAKNKKLAPADPVDAPTCTPSPGRSMSATASEAETPSKLLKQSPPRNWRDELIPATKRTLQPVSQTPDLNEPYWQFHFIELYKLPAKDKLPDEADEKALTPFKLLMATAQTYSIYQPTGQEIDTLTLAHYTAETIADAHAEAPNSRLTLTQPTAESIAIAQEHQSWLDNLDLQRENYDEACKALGIQNPDIPKLPAMRINTALRFWQPVAIYALAQFRENPLLSGCILADMVGLGKTWMVTAYIMHRATKLKGQPTLIVCPPHLVIVYFGDARDQPPVNVKVISKLSKDVSWMTGKKAHHAVVITSYQTLAQRHSPAEYKAWAED